MDAAAAGMGHSRLYVVDRINTDMKKVKNWYWLIAVAWLVIILAERACTA